MLKNLSAILLIALSSCTVMQSLTPSKDPAQKVLKESIRNESKQMYMDMLSGSKDYKDYEQRYSAILAEINNFTAVDSVRKNASLLFKVDKKLRDAFVMRWEWHKEYGTLNDAKVSSIWDYLKTYWDAVQRSEETLK